MKGWKKGMAALLAAVLTAGTAAGCAASMSEYGTTPALTYGDQTVYLDEANFWLRYEQWLMESQYGTMYQYYGYTNMWEAPADEYTTLGQQLKEDVMAQILQTRILNDHAEELGISLTEEDQTRITETVADFRESFDDSFREYCDASDESINGWLQQNALAVKVWDAVKQQAEVTVTDEECQMFSVEYVNITDSTDSTESTESTAAETTAASSESADTTAAETESTEASGEESTAAETESAEASGEESTAAETAGAQSSGEDTTAAETTEAASGETLTGEALANEVLRRLNEGQAFSDFEDELGVTVNNQSFLRSDTDNSSTIYQEAVNMATGEAKMVDYDGGWYVIYCVAELDKEATEEERASVEDTKREEHFNTVYAEWTAAAPSYEVQDAWDDLKVDEMIYVAKETTAAETTAADTTSEETAAESESASGADSTAAEPAESSAEESETASAAESSPESSAEESTAAE